MSPTSYQTAPPRGEVREDTTEYRSLDKPNRRTGPAQAFQLEPETVPAQATPSVVVVLDELRMPDVSFVVPTEVVAVVVLVDVVEVVLVVVGLVVVVVALGLVVVVVVDEPFFDFLVS